MVRKQLIETIGNLMMLAGIYILLYVGGLYTQIEYFRLAARGDNDLAAPAAVMLNVTETAVDAELSPFTVPLLNAAEGRVAGNVPSPSQAAHVSTISRIVIPSINVDSKVVEVGWQVVEEQGQQFAVWDVAEYAVGQHKGSANPGEQGNIVLAGHVGGYGKVFKDLFYVKPGDQITLYSGGQQYLYLVQENLLVMEEGVSPEQRAANAQYIAETDHEVVTLVTCWPPSGPDRFTQRVIVRALPYGATLAPSTVDGPSNWTMR